MKDWDEILAQSKLKVSQKGIGMSKSVNYKVVGEMVGMDPEVCRFRNVKKVRGILLMWQKR